MFCKRGNSNVVMIHGCTRVMLGIIVLACTIESGHTQNLPWCAIMDNDGTTQCNYTSQQQCLQTLSGVGGECVRNPAGNAVEPTPVQPFSGNAQGLVPLQLQDPGPPPGLGGSAPPNN
jgi:hypothetical protein